MGLVVPALDNDTNLLSSYIISNIKLNNFKEQNILGVKAVLENKIAYINVLSL